MQRTVLLVLLFLCTAGAFAQPHLLMIAGETGNLYVEHTVDAKENWYSIGRLYNIGPKDIAKFNQTTIGQPLTVGQHLNIPLTTVNFAQTTAHAAGEVMIPLYHTVQPKEWMYHISSTYNKVPVATLEKWNHIKSDQAMAGMQLIVGYLKVKDGLSAFASQKAMMTQQAVASVPQKTETAPATLASVDKKSAADSHQPETTTKPAAVSATTTPVSYSVSHSNGGYFGTDFTGGSRNMSGQASVFRSTSGWQDGKYYALVNDIPVGTIVKVTNPSTKKSVYAKVLGQLPDMKESAGLIMRISNAAATEMGAGDGRFAVDLNY